MCEITYRLSKTLESTFEGAQSRKVAPRVHPATKNRLLNKHKAKISGENSQNIAALFKLI